MSTTQTGAPNHYQLLRLKPFEADQAVIRKNFHGLAAQLRAKIVAEPTVAKWPTMLGDMTKAMLVLADARRKADYDASIGNKAAQAPKPASLEKILRVRKVLDEAALDKAKKFADTVNVDLHVAVVQQKLTTPDVVMPLFADSLGMPFVDLNDLVIDEALVPTVPAIMARQQSLVPVLVDDGQVIVASPNPLRPEIEEQLQLRFSMSVRQIICTKAAIDAAIEKYYSKETAASQMNTAPKAVKKSSKSGDGDGGEATPRLSKADLRKKKMKVGAIAGMFTATFIMIGGALFLPDLNYTNPWMLRIGGMAAGGIAFLVGFLAVSD